jgi:hypothetical protein
MINLRHFNNLIVFLTSVWSLSGSLQVAQDALSFVHVANTVYSSANVLLSNGFERIRYLNYGKSVSVSFYVLDSLIIVKHIDQWFFWIHHAMALWIAWALHNGAIPVDATISYMFVIELSNIFLTPFALTKKWKRVNAVASIFLAWSYIPLRSLVLPYQTWQLVKATLQVSTAGYKMSLIPIYLALQVLSWLFSWKVYGITRKRLRDAPDLRAVSWAIGTYVMKAYLTLYMAMWGDVGRVFLGADVFSLMISWMFNISNSELLEKLDVVGIYTKIVANGAMAYGSWTHPGNIANIGLLGWNVYALFAKKYKALDEHKWSYTWTYCPHFLLSAYAGLRLNWRYTLASMAAYICGALTWSWWIPERWLPGTSMPSPGWMHLFVMLGDWWWVRGVRG